VQDGPYLGLFSYQELEGGSVPPPAAGRSTTMRQIQIRRRPRTTTTSTRRQTKDLDLRTPSGRPLPF